MKENFNKALSLVLKSEGTWSDNIKDPGGATMKGITLQVYREWKKDPDITKEQLKNISDQEVHDLYQQLYWNKIYADSLPTGIDYALFDASVNMGVLQSTKLIQKTIGVTADGAMGPKSISAIQANDSKELIEKFSTTKEDFYKGLKLFPVFGKGWLNRVVEVKKNAVSMIG
jgi:lysozyme family protein